MRRILKYSLADAFLGVYFIPGVVRVLHVGLQDDKPFIWVEADDQEDLSSASGFTVYPTGGYPHGEHVGTFFMDDGALVFHVYRTPR